MTGPASPDELPPSAPAPPHLHARAVPWRHALAWFEEGMRLFKRGPGTWIGLGFCTIAVELGLAALPYFGPLAAQIVAPLVAGGMACAAAAADGGAAPSLRHAVAAFGAPWQAALALIVANLVAFAGQWVAAWWIADINLLAPGGPDAPLSGAVIAGMAAIGVLASLPFLFVPYHVLVERAGAVAAFRASWMGFALNTEPLLVYAGAALALVGLGAATMGFGLLLALPLLATVGYAAWKDVFGVGVAPTRRLER